MTAAELALRVGAVLGALPAQEVTAQEVTVTVAYDQVSVVVPREGWVASVMAVRDDPGLALVFFDRLTAVDEGPAGLELWLYLWSPEHRHGLQVRTRCPYDDASVPSLTGVFAGAAWHERETAEMFAIDFVGHPDLRPLLLPDGFQGHPLRKDFVLAARVAKEWPGRKEPGEVVGDRPPRRRLQPPGVPGPGGWPA